MRKKENAYEKLDNKGSRKRPFKIQDTWNKIQSCYILSVCQVNYFEFRQYVTQAKQVKKNERF